jgi:hypothetical protein
MRFAPIEANRYDVVLQNNSRSYSGLANLINRFGHTIEDSKNGFGFHYELMSTCFARLKEPLPRFGATAEGRLNFTMFFAMGLRIDLLRFLLIELLYMETNY